MSPDERYGKLLVVRHAGFHKRRGDLWLCWCDCGGEKIIPQIYLKSGDVKSCGCGRRVCNNGLWKGFGKIPGWYWERLKRCASKRGIEFNASIENACYLFTLQRGKCALSGWDIHFDTRESQTASLDRVDSALGYTNQNIQWLHKEVNMMKSNFSDEQIIQMARAISKHNENERPK